jgi:uncharacterized protein (TIGR02452 family)
MAFSPLTRETLIDVAKETLAAVERGAYTTPSGREAPLRDSVDPAVQATRTYSPDELDALVARLAEHPPAVAAATHVEVTTETTAQAGRRLVEEEGIGRVVALNFASGKNPGGGFLRGAKAQEEDLARCSALYACLAPQRAYYDANRGSPSEIYTDYTIYSPDVPFFRDDQLRLLERPFPLSIITSPAPNAGVALDRDPEAGGRIREVLAARAGKVLAVAADQGHRCLVLGAWGCGVFRNDPAHVAATFARWLADARFRGAFERVVFAVYDPGGRNLRAFEQVFGAARPL